MAKNNRHRDLPPQPVGTTAPEVTPPPAPTPLEMSPVSDLLAEDAPAGTEAPTPAKPAWQHRVSAHAAERQQLFDVKPGSFLARRTSSPVRRHELERKGHNVERLTRLGVVVRVTDTTETIVP